MPWYSHLIPESWKKRACRYLLQRYVGHFLKEKLSLDQLSVDLYSGKGVIKELNLDVEALNNALETFNIPLEIVDGFIGSISVSIPWSSLLTSSTSIEITGLELTIQPKQWDEQGATLDTLSMINSMSMTSSLQLAEEVLRSEKTTEGNISEVDPFEGVQIFAQAIDTVLSRIKMSFSGTTIRLEHLPNEADKGVALEVRIDRMDYFDDMATEQNVEEQTEEQGSPVDDPSLGHLNEPAAFVHKNIHVVGITFYFDNVFCNPSGSLSTTDSSTKIFESTANSLYTSSSEVPLQMSQVTTQPKSLGSLPLSGSQPIQIAVLTGKQELKVQLKQQDALPGPKLELVCQFGAFHLLLSPSQFHGILELAGGLAAPATCRGGRFTKRSSKDKPMRESDFQRVERELQSHLQSTRLGQNRSPVSLHSDLYSDESVMQSVGELQEEELYLSTHSHKERSLSDMECSISSNYSGSTARTSSTVTSYQRSEVAGLTSRRSPSVPKSKDALQKLLDDPSAELSRHHLKISFISVNILHENPTSTPGDHFCPDIPASEKLKKMSEIFFNKVKVIPFAGLTSLTHLRDKFSEALPYDHLGCLGKPLTLQIAQKTSRSGQSLSLDVTLGMFETTECLCERRNFTSSLLGFGLPVDDKPPKYCELLTFDVKDEEDTKPVHMYSSTHSTIPAIKLRLIKAEKTRSSSKAHLALPRTDVRLELGVFHSEVDISIVDRINSLLSPEPLMSMEASAVRGKFSYSQLNNTSSVGRQMFNQVMQENPALDENLVDFHVASDSGTVNFRFPVPDLRTGPQVDRVPWWHRNIHKESLILQMANFSFQTCLGTDPQCKLEFTCSDLSAYFKEDLRCDPILLVSVISDDGCDLSERNRGFNWPRLVITFSEKICSVFEDEQVESDDSTPMDSLNGACQFSRTEPSPFSAKKSMYEQEDLSSFSDRSSKRKNTSEEKVIPGDKEEMKEFQEKAISNTKMHVEITLPIVTAFLPSKNMFEIIYNRLNNDLLMWEPMAPSPLKTKDSLYDMQPADLNVLNLCQHGYHETFEMAKSGLQYDSDTDSDENFNYSIHESRRKKQPLNQRQLQSKLCVSLNIMKGKLLAVVPNKEEKSHGEILVEVDDTVLFSVISYNGDPDLRYLCFQTNKIALSSAGCVNHIIIPGDLNQIREESLPDYLERTIHRSDRGVASKFGGLGIGCGGESPDMLSLALRIKLDTVNNRKDFQVAVGVRGATLKHRMVPNGQSWISQCLDFLDVTDFPILGYVDPKVVTELHIHLLSCAVDYRPLYLPLRAILAAEAFSISSNIVANSPTTLLRFHLEDAALFLSAKNYMEVNLEKDYVCVADLERFELSLRTSGGKDQMFPKTNLRLSSNRFNIRTCADSCKALTELIRYIADEGDLMSCDAEEDIWSQTKPDTVSTSRDSSLTVDTGSDTSNVSQMNLDHVNTMMADAMLESSGTESGSGSDSPGRQMGGKKTQVFFLPDHQKPGAHDDDDDVTESDSRLQQITISNSAESVSSSVQSDQTDQTETLSDEEEFCIINEAGWGIAPRDGEPAIRVFIKEPLSISDNHFSQPLGKIDQLKAPEHFPAPEKRYTLIELTLVWYLYGGKDFGGKHKDLKKLDGDLTSQFDRGSLVGASLGKRSRSKEKKVRDHDVTWLTRGGPNRDLNTVMEIQLTKVQCQHESYPATALQASRQVLIIQDLEIRDRLSSSQINKFLYQYTSESMPRQTHANMVLVKSLHVRPESSTTQECSLKVSLLPLRFNIDQDSLFFLKNFISELRGVESVETPAVSVPNERNVAGSPKSSSSTPPPPAPIMTVNSSPTDDDSHTQQDLLIMFDEIDRTEDLLKGTLEDSASSLESDQANSQPVFFKSFIFSPDVPIRLDYHGKRVDMEQGTFQGLLVGLAQLNSSELRLKRLNYKHGILGTDKLIQYAACEWSKDIRRNQLPSILGGVGPMYSFVQIFQGVKDLFWLPVEQYRKDGRIVRGIQRGASSFTTSTAMALLELTNKVVQSIQWIAELTYDMLSPGPSVRVAGTRRHKHARRGQPLDIREGMTNAYIVVREGITDTAGNLVRAATEEQEQKGFTGAVGGVLRQIPPTIIQPVIIASEATSKVLGGMRNQLRPEAKKEDEEKWRDGKS
ncbi:autophagy-related protein 2 homolog A-like isoform X2 [Gigantopelta aegis]|uniref:autophagy-related protein 2 homolog A-like isoform X2 n=1 Tax=Gigantopelta aegis TaxID=1735272 RepID=UPI001B88B11E|nr:autophagy-related protein 2 homolog A-like isoform X2 [Gigantopelta aegis]